MDIPDFNSKARYDIRLLNRNKDETWTDVTWAMDVDYRRLLHALLELVVMKEKNVEAFAGDIIISTAGSQDPMPRYRRLQEGSPDSGSTVLRIVPSPREGSSKQHPGHNNDSEERHRRAQQALDNSQMMGYCCSHIAGRHSNLAPFKCLVDRCECSAWDSGE